MNGVISSASNLNLSGRQLSACLISICTIFATKIVSAQTILPLPLQNLSATTVTPSSINENNINYIQTFSPLPLQNLSATTVTPSSINENNINYIPNFSLNSKTIPTPDTYAPNFQQIYSTSHINVAHKAVNWVSGDDLLGFESTTCSLSSSILLKGGQLCLHH